MQVRRGHAARVHIAAHWKLLAHAHRLEVHTEQHRHRLNFAAVRIPALDLVDDRPHFRVVVRLDRRNAIDERGHSGDGQRVRPVTLRRDATKVDAVYGTRCLDLCVDLGRVKIDDACA